MSSKVAFIVRVVAVVAWAVSAVNILPDGWVFDLRPDQGLFAIAVACVASYAWIARVHAKPAVEMYLAGKEMGRLQYLLEQQCENVQRIPAAPDLRVVSGGR